MINVNSPTFNKQLRKEKTPDGKSNYVFSDSDVMEIYNGAIHDMSYEQRELFKKNYIPKKMPTFENNFKQANYSNMLKITLKESEFRTLIEKTVRKALNESFFPRTIAFNSMNNYYRKIALEEILRLIGDEEGFDTIWDVEKAIKNGFQPDDVFEFYINNENELRVRFL